MLELIFQGFIEWTYGLILECWEYFSSMLLNVMSMDFAYLKERMPVIQPIMQTMLALGWALLIGNLVFQAVRGMMTGLGFEAEDPNLENETQLVQTVANTIILNTSGPREANDFWSRAELNLLMAMLHYVCNLRDKNDRLLPIEERSLGAIYKILATETVEQINARFAKLPPDHPAKGPHGLFLKAKDNLWGSIITGLGNRLAVFQNQLVNTVTRNHDVDLLLPGQKPCAYFIIISAQDSAYRFLSSLFFSLAIPMLSDYARLQCPGGRLPVLVNFCLDEYLNIGHMEISDALNSIRGFNMTCQVVVQSLSQWQEKYPGKEWENQLATFNQTLYLGCNDLTSAKYISEKCGKVTISVTNNQMPLMPLFSPVYTSTRPSSVNSGYSDCTLRITYAAALDSDSSLVLGDTGNPNTVTLTWKRSNAAFYDTLTDTAIVYSFGLDVTKNFSDGRGDATKVEFLIQNSTDNRYLTGALNASEGVWYVTGVTADANSATHFVPTAAGKLTVKGVEDDAYTLTEVKTDAAYAV